MNKIMSSDLERVLSFDEPAFLMRRRKACEILIEKYKNWQTMDFELLKQIESRRIELEQELSEIILKQGGNNGSTRHDRI